jgi:flagellum-specific peptidoglycan hydrolase FlgJ
MLTQEQKDWTEKTFTSACLSGHIFPYMAACEAALESRFGESQLAREGNNLFGMKKHQHNLYGVLALPTKEFTRFGWTEVDAEWEKYDSLEKCFEDRMSTLNRLRSMYTEYELALTANNETKYIVSVSLRWSTDPQRAIKVMDLRREIFGDLEREKI